MFNHSTSNSKKPAHASRQSIRQHIRAKRKALSITEQKLSAESLSKTLQLNENVISAKSIALYLANDGELNLAPFIRWCWQNNKAVYLPVVHPFSKGNLLFLRYSDHSEMTINKYGIKEPKLDIRHILPTQQLDIIFTPLVAFDETGERIGMGGGYYDRTLAKWHESYKIDKQSKPYPIGIAHDCQQIDKVPTELWDIPLPEIITPSKNIRSSI
ncbi:5-formyltetrahydrofolate cyclo-ligase [bacterium]|nr:5-formyltetrahydrofolate cyclo-ligase [bacterium]